MLADYKEMSETIAEARWLRKRGDLQFLFESRRRRGTPRDHATRDASDGDSLATDVASSGNDLTVPWAFPAPSALCPLSAAPTSRRFIRCSRIYIPFVS